MAKITRDAFLYLEPARGDEQEQFAQCGTCVLFNAEAQTCGLFSSNDPVTADMSCGFYVPGANEDDLEPQRLVTPEEAGLVDRQVRCENCAWFNAEKSGCELYYMLNKAHPDAFDLDEKVYKYGCCNAQTPAEPSKAAMPNCMVCGATCETRNRGRTQLCNKHWDEQRAQIGKAQKRRRLAPLPKVTETTQLAQGQIQRAVQRALNSVKQSALAAVHTHKVAKIGEEPETPDDIIEQIDFTGLLILAEGVTLDQLEEAAREGARMALAQVSVIGDDNSVIQANTRALQAAKDQAAALVGMKYDDNGELIENPNPAYAIDQSTRDMLRGTISDGMEQGLGMDGIAAAIEDSYAFSADRSMMIARTETMRAHALGALEGYKSARDNAGVNVQKEWLADDMACEEICIPNMDQGPIDLDDVFDSGDDAPPGHPNCECSLIPSVVDDQGNETDGEDTDVEMAARVRLSPERAAEIDAWLAKYSEDQPRDEQGRWTSGGGSGPESSDPGSVKSASELYDKYTDLSRGVDGAIEDAAKQLGMTPENVREELVSGATVSALTTDTREDPRFVNPDGKWNAEREALHQKVLSDIFTPERIAAATPPMGEKPTFTMLGGRAGSGKSFLTNPKEGGPVDRNKNIVIDADDIKKELGAEVFQASAYHEESSQLAEAAMARARELGVNVVYDATMRSPGGVASKAGDFKEAGYKVDAYYMFAPPQKSAVNAITRYVKGGRYVPPSYTISSTSNEKSFDQMVRGNADNWYVYDNHGGTSARTAKLVLEGHK